MKVLPIVTDVDVLKKVSKEVALPLDNKDKQLLLDMIEYLKNSQDEQLSEQYNIRPGVGLAAIQLGIEKRMFVVHFEDEDEQLISYALINPKITSHSIKETYLANGEGCLSVPEDVPGHVYRYYKITLKAFDALTNKKVTIKARGYFAIVLQHELDHLNGILYYEKINKEDPFLVKEGSIPI